MPRRDTPKTPRGAASETGRCRTCDKLTYPTRRAARAAARRHPDTKARPYLCPHGLGWHLGHLYPNIIAGNVDRSVYRTGDTTT